MAVRLLRVVSVLVPQHLRRDWMEEWTGELAALEDARASGTIGVPHPLVFVRGALVHGVWLRTEGWTMDSVVQDMRYAARRLLRAPGFAAIAALTLALGIGANASIFSLVNGLILRAPAGVAEPDRLVQVARSYEDAPRWDNMAWPTMALAREQGVASGQFIGMAGYSGSSLTLGQGAEVEQTRGLYVTGDYFDVVGARPSLGRLLRPDDDVVGNSQAVVVLSHDLWTNRYGSDPAMIGQAIQIGARPFEVVGVAQAGFAGVESVGTPPSLFLPLTQRSFRGDDDPYDQWGFSWISVVGRLADGATMDGARSAMAVISERLREASPENENILLLLEQGVGLDPEGRVEARQLSAMLLLIVGLVLLITCTNVANLLLARASSRRSEVGVRMAIGAGRSRLLRQLVTESGLLAILATLLAVPVVLLAGRILPALFPYALSVSVEPDVRVFVFLAATGLLTGVLFGAAPAWAISGREALKSLREGGSTGGRQRTRLRDGLVVVQWGLSLGLVASAALLGRSVLNARFANPGFDPKGMAVSFVDLSSTGRYDEEAGMAFMQALHEQASRLPGVTAATVANSAPMTGGHARASVAPVGQEEGVEAEYIVVGPDYFETLGIPIRRGRALGGFDDEPERVVVVNQTLADLFWPGQDPIGQEIERRGTWRVVGVSEDVQMRSLRARPNPAVYYPVAHAFSPWMAVQLRAGAASAADGESLRSAVASVDPNLPVQSHFRLTDVLVQSMGETRTIGYLVSAFAGLALVLAVVGLYGLVSCGASERVRELGIRKALGATQKSLIRLILNRGLMLAAGGVVLGLAIATALGSALRNLLYGVGSADVLTLLAASVTLMGAAVLASWLPARRASRVDPTVSLRE